MDGVPRPGEMLRIWRASGEEIALPVASPEELHDVKLLKQQLRMLYGYPVCVQSILHSGNCLADSAPLDVA